MTMFWWVFALVTLALVYAVTGYLAWHVKPLPPSPFCKGHDR